MKLSLLFLSCSKLRPADVAVFVLVIVGEDGVHYRGVFLSVNKISLTLFVFTVVMVIFILCKYSDDNTFS